MAGSDKQEAMPASPAPPPAPVPFGVPVPWFRAKAIGGRDVYTFDTTAGRHILMLFLGSAALPEAQGALAVAAANRDLFDDEAACFFGVTVDPADAAQRRVTQSLPGIRFFLDEDQAVSRLYGAVAEGGQYRPHWLLIDPALRALGPFPIGAGEAAVAALRRALSAAAPEQWAPVLLAPNILEPQLCARLIDYYKAEGGSESGFMREVAGKTVLVTDPAHKLRRDCTIEDEALRVRLQAAVKARLLPMVKRAFQFEATRMERYLIGCYDSGTGGHFRPHRDNTTKGTAHRRFAVSINLNAEDHEGGDLRFPEYGPRTYRPPTGGAVVFSCSLLHEATPMVSGTRYAFLPFLYDEEAARQREANTAFVEGELASYRA
jgi:predicted 2-oxoglutarate/Fe(II)-dependent dioxygenase YbiX/peroxiredoxin